MTRFIGVINLHDGSKHIGNGIKNFIKLRGDVSLIVIPAIDLKEGRCVRLFQGQADKETVYSEDPVEVAQRWQSSGAAMLHVVDLDGAFQGLPRNLPIVERIVKAVDIPVQ